MGGRGGEPKQFIYLAFTLSLEGLEVVSVRRDWGGGAGSGCLIYPRTGATGRGCWYILMPPGCPREQRATQKAKSLFATLRTASRQAPLSPWDSPGKNTGVGCHLLLQGIFPTLQSTPFPVEPRSPALQVDTFTI